MDSSNSTVIVAIPRADDHVWKISSEKVPHLTLLFLGDLSEDPRLGKVLEYVEHAASTTLYRFGLSVDRRGLLGDNDADVLFFEKDYGTANLEEFRSNLLKDQTIAQAYHSVSQYPSWTPHLTLGYPETPAKKDERDFPVAWVEFDRIALWTGDYEGPEILLKRRTYGEYGELEMRDRDDHFLEHFGVKGMKWGVRKDSRLRPKNWMAPNEIDSIGWDRMISAQKKVNRHTSYGAAWERDVANYRKVEAEVQAERAAARRAKMSPKQLAKADAKWEKKATGQSAYITSHNAAAKRMNNTEIPRINNKPEYKNKDFSKDSPLRRKYYKEYSDVFNRILLEEHRRIFGLNPSGSKRMDIVDGDFRLVDVRHAEADFDFDVDIDFDENGYIVSFNLVSKSVEHGALAHYGVKGMRWGIRRKRVPASEDAERVSASMQKARKGGTRALTTKELQELVNRMNLEQQYSRLQFEKKKGRFEKGHGFVKNMVGVGKTMNEVMNFMNSPFGKLIRGKLK